jgi:hypothetical protein
MRVLVSGDHHFDETRRFDECLQVHQWMVDMARIHKVDAFLSGGDIYERASTPRERDAVSSWLVKMADVCPVVIARGNHDRQLDCQIMAKLQSRHSIIVEESCGVHYVGDLAIAVVAWPERARILQLAAASGDDPDAVMQDALGWLFRGLAQELAAHEGPKVVLGHFMVDGSETSTGQPLIGQPIRVSLEQFDLLNADMVLMGHIHKPQDWQTTVGLTPVIYTGSPYRTSFGEAEQKSVVLADFSPDLVLPHYLRLPTPCRAMHLVTETWTTHAGFGSGVEAHLTPDAVSGSEIRFRYNVPSDQRLAARETAQEWADVWTRWGAVYVKLEEVVQTTSEARAPEVALAVGLADKLAALWKARNTIPEPARQERLLTMAGELEREAS